MVYHRHNMGHMVWHIYYTNIIQQKNQYCTSLEVQWLGQHPVHYIDYDLTVCIMLYFTCLYYLYHSSVSIPIYFSSIPPPIYCKLASTTSRLLSMHAFGLLLSKRQAILQLFRSYTIASPDNHFLPSFLSHLYFRI